ncbi:probable phosphatidylethanolamine N-methyltransferase [hydrothermal vent metagenome]|uniref:Probable phosphatidylethanolamine N-methyltransferase n=1 Tax=hydrothermal vent metagenome TaxID=652676 RepID=A0A3B1B8F2_9ZZZZ
MALQHSYRFIAPIYNKIVARATYNMRKKSIEQIASVENKKILIAGIGTGLDIPHLNTNAHYTGIDITPSMLRKIPSNTLKSLDLCIGDVMQLPYKDNSFDIVLMHLILAVVPNSQKALLEASRVTKSGGSIIVLDKFLRPTQKAYFRRLISPLIGQIATQTNVVFEKIVNSCPNLTLISDEETELSSWFRRIELQKQ